MKEYDRASPDAHISKARYGAPATRLDADLLSWLKQDGRGWHARANQMLRERMLTDLEGRLVGGSL
ncbi:MAG: BrnA antitoxin family protein [Acidobacteriota bacterium]|nr:BrnA antitoxin family protein [Acidobacteriota bacterium]